MNLLDLKYIVTVADTHRFGQAAEHCFVSQPKLEEELGVIARAHQAIGGRLWVANYKFAHKNRPLVDLAPNDNVPYPSPS